LAELQGIPVARRKVLAAGIAGTLAGIGGGLYAHLTTYVEPRIFDIMLGVHSLAYGLIGGPGAAIRSPPCGFLHHRPLATHKSIGRVSHDHLRRARCLAVDRAPARFARRDGGAQDRPWLAASFPMGTAVKPETEGKQRLSDWRMAVKSATYVIATLAMLAPC